MPKSQLSPKAQIGLVLGTLLFFSVVLVIVGFAATNQTSAKLAAFASNGATVTGTITKKYIHSVARNWVYWLDVQFRTSDGAIHNESTNVANTIFDGLEEGQPVQVTYVKSNPQWFYVAGDAPTQRDVGTMDTMSTIGIVSAVLCAFGLLVLFFWDRIGGALPARTTNVTSAVGWTTEPSPQRGASAPRTAFGTRRS